jgi:NADPH:quinone reductase
MTYRMIVRETGGPERIEREEIDLPPPGPGMVQVRHTAVGLNFIDTYVRTGLYKAELPAALGQEAAGVVEAVGEGVGEFSPGDRVAYATGPIGGYSSARQISADHLVPLPDVVSDEVAAAAMLKGMTAAFLVEKCAKVRAGDTVLVLAAAGGVGSILVQWLAAIGARVIAHAGSAEKAQGALANGAQEALHCPFEELAGRVRALTDGRGVDAVLDGVGAASWTASLASLRRRGLMVAFGNASGAIPPFNIFALRDAGSVFVTRPTLFDYASTPDELRALAGRLFEMIEGGKVRVEIGQRFDLADAAAAHIALEGRRTRGSTLLIP